MGVVPQARIRTILALMSSYGVHELTPAHLYRSVHFLGFASKRELLAAHCLRELC
jgi:hypothetical protein